MEFAEVRTLVFAAHNEGAYQRGLDAIEGCETNDEAEQTDLAFWKMCLLSRLARLAEACEVFARSLELSRWWGPAMLADPDFQNVREVPDWILLSEESQLRARDAGQASPLPIDLVPDTEVRATLVLLHGAGAVPRAIAERCEFAVELGFRVIAFCGDEAYASNRWGWSLASGDLSCVRQTESLGNLVNPLLVLGFSQGGGLAGYLGWSGSIRCDALLLFAPSFMIRGIPVPSSRLVRVPTYLHVGSEDRSLHDARQVATNLDRGGVPVRLVESPGLGHDWPADLAHVLAEAIAWVRGKP